MEKRLRLAISGLLIAAALFVFAAWQSPTKSYIVVRCKGNWGMSKYAGSKGDVEYATLQEALNNLAKNGYRITSVNMVRDETSTLVIMEK